MFADNPDARAESLQMLTAYLGALFEPGDILEFRCLKARRKTIQKWATLAELPGIHDALCDLNDDRFNIYFGCNPRTVAGGATANEVEIARAHYIDLDGGVLPGELVERVAQAGLREPTAVVFTGGGSQAALRLAEPMPVDEWCARQKALNASIDGADSTICDAPRILRCPGFVNRKPKYGPAFPMARVEHASGHIFQAAEFPTMPDGQPGGYEGPGADGAPVRLNIETNGLLPKFVDDFLKEGTLIQPGGKAVPSRRETAFQVAIQMKAAGIPMDDAGIRICARLVALGLDEDDVADFRRRQLRNAYGQERTPRIDPEHLPVAVARPLPAEPEVTITDAGNGKHRVVCRRGLKAHIDTIDLAKQSARQKFLKDCGAALGEGTDTAFVDDRLKAVATGDEQAAEPEGPQSEFIPVDDFIRPERFAITVGGEHVSGTTVPKYRMGEDGIEGVWMTHLAKGDGSRECIELPRHVEVGGKSFYMNPNIGPPSVTKQLGWSASGQDAWHTTGACVLPPDKLFHELRVTFSEFIDFTDDVSTGAANVLALWTVLTYTPSVFPVVPFLVFNGPKGSGKTQVLNCLKNVCFRCLTVANPSAASLYRELHTNGGTVLIDEAEQLESADAEPGLMTALLHSNQRGATVPRCEGEDFTPTHFGIGGPKAFFSIREPHDPLADRSISIQMLRSPPGSPKAFMHPDAGRFAARWQLLRDALFVFVMNHGQALTDLVDCEAVTPTTMFPRSRQTWGPLLSLAHLFERLGVAGLLESVQRFAVDRAERSEAVTVDEVDELVLRAFVALRDDTKAAPPTSGAVQAKAFALGLDANLRLTAATTGKILRRYGIRHGSGRARRAWVSTDEHLRQVADNYGIDLSQKNTVGTPPGNVSPLSPLSPLSPNAGSGDTSGDKHPQPKTLKNRPQTAIGDRCDKGDTNPEGVPGSVSGKVVL